MEFWKVLREMLPVSGIRKSRPGVQREATPVVIMAQQLVDAMLPAMRTLVSVPKRCPMSLDRCFKVMSSWSCCLWTCVVNRACLPGDQSLGPSWRRQQQIHSLPVARPCIRVSAGSLDSPGVECPGRRHLTLGAGDWRVFSHIPITPSISR